MKRMKWLITLVCLILPVTCWGTSVTVSFSPQGPVDVGDAFTVDILADINPADGLLGWGLDLDFQSSYLTLTDTQVNTALWTQPVNSDDGLAGNTLSFPPVSGANFLLATLSFEAIADGTANLSLGTDDPLLEGFMFLSGSADVTYQNSSIIINPSNNPGPGPGPAPVPEPATMFLLGFGLVGLAGVSRKKFKK